MLKYIEDEQYILEISIGTERVLKAYYYGRRPGIDFGLHTLLPAKRGGSND
ncbi:hypothetical protein ACFLWU_05855 [Chloroflexota bacterium]